MRYTVLLVALCACNSIEPGVFVGPVGALETRLGLVTNEAGGLAYVAGGITSMERHHTWVEMVPEGSRLEGYADGITLSAEPDGDTWRGSMSDLAGDGGTFVLARATKQDGVFATDTPTDSECEIGAVVLQGVLQGVYCGPGELPTTATSTTAEPETEYAQLVVVGEITGDTIDVQTDTDPPIDLVLTPAKP